MRVGEAEGDPEGDGCRTLANGWESRLWKLEDKHLREGSSVRQFGRPRPLRIRHRRRRRRWGIAKSKVKPFVVKELSKNTILIYCAQIYHYMPAGSKCCGVPQCFHL